MAHRARNAMIDGQLQPSAVLDEGVIAAMGVVQRERFVPEIYRACAYADAPVALGAGRVLLSPLVTAQMMQAIKPQEHEKALVIAGATGYSAAVLALLGAEVIMVEDEPQLMAQAREVLAAECPKAVQVVQAPLSAGYAALAPYAIIVIDGAVEQVPSVLWQQLAEGGRLCVIEKKEGARFAPNVAGVGELVCYHKQQGALHREVMAQAVAPVLAAFSVDTAFAL